MISNDFEKMKAIKTVYIGTSDIASQGRDFYNGFKELGVKVKLIRNTKSNVYQSSKININLYWLYSFVPLWRPRRITSKIRKYWVYLVDCFVYRRLKRDCDLFIYVYSTIKDDFSDLVKLKSFGIKVVFFFVGDDVRWYPAMRQDFLRFGLQPIEYKDKIFYSEGYMEKRLRFLRNAEMYADLIFSHPNQSQLALRPYYRGYVMVNVRKPFHVENQREKCPVIIHAPTSPEGKGTKHVLAAVAKLKADGIDFTFKLLENVPYDEVFIEYSNADILIGQLLAPGGGKQERELMSLAKVVLSSATYSYDSLLFKTECPIIDVNPLNLADVLKKIILDYPYRKKIAAKGPAYVEAYHQPKMFCEKILNLLEMSEEIRKYDYYPHFFRDEFVPESEKSIIVYNKYTNMVKDCVWYKTHIRPGARSGLIF